MSNDKFTFDRKSQSLFRLASHWKKKMMMVLKQAWRWWRSSSQPSRCHLTVVVRTEGDKEIDRVFECEGHCHVLRKYLLFKSKSALQFCTFGFAEYSQIKRYTLANETLLLYFFFLLNNVHQNAVYKGPFVRINNAKRVKDCFGGAFIWFLILANERYWQSTTKYEHNNSRNKMNMHQIPKLEVYLCVKTLKDYLVHRCCEPRCSILS